MPTLCQQQHDGTSYRVVRVGHTLRLYRNNVLHSQWNSKHAVTGKLWDLFLISVLGLNKNLQQVLVLGAGGGSVINLIHHYYPDANIDAIDYDQTHLDIAKKYFEIDTTKCKLICADAQEWLAKNKTHKYDLIIDDVFNEIDNIPYRSVKSNQNWAQYLLKSLNTKGVLVFNFADHCEWKSNFKLWNKHLSNKNVSVATHHKCDNKIVHLSAEDISLRTVKPVLNTYKVYNRYFVNKTISYRTVNKLKE